MALLGEAEVASTDDPAAGVGYAVTASLPAGRTCGLQQVDEGAIRPQINPRLRPGAASEHGQIGRTNGDRLGELATQGFLDEAAACSRGGGQPS